MIPVIFTHRGDQDYARVAVKQAKQWNGRVVLLGDESNIDWELAQVDIHRIADYFSDDARHIADYYVHMCSNPHDFELYNLQEFFVLREFMRREGLAKMFACDSDVMIYADLTEEEKKYGDYLAVYSIPQEQWEYRWSASAHSAYWTLSGLDAFCEFIEETYTKNLAKLQEKWQWHQDSGTGGGICDMTLLWLFYEKNVGSVHDICRVWRQGHELVSFDHNIRAGENTFPDEYQMKENLKGVAWLDTDQPICWHLELGQYVRFATLHFQNGAKPLMESCYRERT